LENIIQHIVGVRSDYYLAMPERPWKETLKFVEKRLKTCVHPYNIDIGLNLGYRAYHIEPTNLKFSKWQEAISLPFFFD